MGRVKDSGVNIKIMKAQSVRSTSLTNTKTVAMTLCEILKRFCLIAESTFQKQYGQYIIDMKNSEFNYAKSLLKSFKDELKLP